MIDLLAWALMLPCALATLVMVVELIAAQWSRPLPPATTPDSPPRIAILIPANNEASAIEATVKDIGRVAPAGSRILVVADNCSDDTADLARLAGAEVIERDDPVRLGKGHAIAFGRDHLVADPPEVVVIIDADCAIPGDGILRLAMTARRTGRPVQSTYLLRPRPDRGQFASLSGFAFLIRNLVRQRGLARIGAPALLTGSGMAFDWAVFGKAPLATSDLVEDLALGLHFVRAGMPPLFLEDVLTLSEPASRKATYGQRVRWEQGFLRRAGREALPLLTTGQWPLFWLGLHLLVPPLALLVTIDAMVWLLLNELVAWGATPVPLILLSTPLFTLPILIGLSWARFGRAQIGAAQLLLAPFYILWKLPIYIAAIVRPERRWNRTDRD